MNDINKVDILTAMRRRPLCVVATSAENANSETHVQNEIRGMVGAIVPKARCISIQELLNYEENIECAISRSDDNVIESIFM